MKKILTLALLGAIAFPVSCSTDGKEEDKTPLLEGVWSSDPTGNATKISISDAAAMFVSFAGDKWATLYDSDNIGEWYITGIEYSGGNDFVCLYWYDEGHGTQEATATLADDARTFTVKTDGEEEVWYKQSSEPVKFGKLSFWTDTDDGRLAINIYDASYNVDYLPVDVNGVPDIAEWERYRDEHLVYRGTLSTFFPSGIPGCGQNGTLRVDATYGTYRYTVSNSSAGFHIPDRRGTVTLNKECMLVKIN